MVFHGRLEHMRIAVVSDGEGGGRLRELGSGSGPHGGLWQVSDLAGAISDYQGYAGGSIRWIWAATDDLYPALMEHSLRIPRCHDIALVESLLLAYHGRFGEARSLGAAWARLHGRDVPPDPVSRAGEGADPQPTLFEPDRSAIPAGVDRLDALIEVHADQQRRIAELPHPGRFALLASVESAGALAAVEMSHSGVPWRADIHDAVLTEHLGARPPSGMRPPVLAELAGRISEEFGRRVNPDSPTQLLKAFSAIGHPVPSTRSWVIKQVDHPVVPLLLRYKELSRLHSAHGWTWLENWVSRGRFRPDYVVGGVVSGRWATRGGGALQIPKAIRKAVVADPEWTLIAADAGQLEPRVLAAVSGDDALAAAAGGDDLYAPLARSFGGDRQRAKVAVLSALYGQTGGDAAPLLRTMRRDYPSALAYVDSAAQAGEEGGLVRSWLGRTCPQPSQMWRRLVLDGTGGGPSRDGGRSARERGRFTRNFVVQATAAEWALVFMAAVRRGLAELGSTYGTPQMVFFQHDELVLHVPRPVADSAVAVLYAAAEEARTLMFGDISVRFPLEVAVVDCYADA